MRPVELAPDGTYTDRIIIDEWIDGPLTEGLHTLRFAFRGLAMSSNQGKRIPVNGAEVLQVAVLPRDENVLRRKSEELATVARTTTDPTAARFAARVLAQMRDPVSISALQSIIEAGKTHEITSVEFAGIHALERAGTPEARAALMRARSNCRPVAAEEIENALVRLLSRK